MSPSPTVSKALDQLSTELRRRFADEVVGLWLFGSHARGEAHEGSDVDVLVLLERPDWMQRRRVLDLAADIGLEHEIELSATIFDRATWKRWRRQERPLIRDVERERIAL